MNGDPGGAKPSVVCLGDEVGKLNASCVEEMAVLPDERAFFDEPNRLANQLIVVAGCL